MTIPKEAVHRELGQAGVYMLDGDRLEWRKITEGISSATRVAVSGLKESDAVALPTDKPLKPGIKVTPAFPLKAKSFARPIISPRVSQEHRIRYSLARRPRASERECASTCVE